MTDIDLDKLEALADAAIHDPTYDGRSFEAAANPATIKSLIASEREAAAEIEDARALIAESIGLVTEGYDDADLFLKKGRAFLARAAQMDGERGRMADWQPIETAPKDGSLILCFYANRYGQDRYSLRYWAQGDWPPSGRTEGWCDQHRQLRKNDPTHWTPLPNPPQPQKGEP